MSESFERWRADVASMITAAERAMSYTDGMSYDDFLDDNRTIDATVMNLVILAEASKGVPLDIQDANPDVPWESIAGFRNRAAHASKTIDLSLDLVIVWQICATNLPEILPKLRDILAR